MIRTHPTNGDRLQNKQSARAISWMTNRTQQQKSSGYPARLKFSFKLPSPTCFLLELDNGDKEYALWLLEEQVKMERAIIQIYSSNTIVVKISQKERRFQSIEGL